MKNTRFTGLILTLLLGCAKTEEEKRSEQYQKDKAYYESFIDPYTYPDGQCVGGCNKVDGKCVLDSNVEMADWYGLRGGRIGEEKPSVFPPGQQYNTYWTRNLRDTPDVYTMIIHVNFNQKTSSSSNTYYLEGQYSESTFGPYTLPSGYTVPYTVISGYQYGYQLKAIKRPEGDTFFSELFAFGKDRTLDGKTLKAFVRGSFTPDYKQMRFYWEYRLRTNPGVVPAEYEVYKKSPLITLDYH